MGKVVLHIGLHKTATRFLQRAVFRNLDSDQYLFNPPQLMKALGLALRQPGAEARSELIAEINRTQALAGERTLIVSKPTISGDMYGNHRNFEDNLKLMRAGFPDATILYFVRSQADWLQSAYRQSLVKGRGAPIETFLNYYEGKFHPSPGRFVRGVRNVDALGLRFLEIYRRYAEVFGPEQVWLFRQEDLRINGERVYGRLAELLGLPALPTLPRRVSGNRAFSAQAIRIFFPSTWSPPHRPAPDEISDHKMETPTRMARFGRRLRTALIKHGFDKVIYRDWDLLASQEMRDAIERYYAPENARLAAAAERILKSGPGAHALEAAVDDSFPADVEFASKE